MADYPMPGQTEFSATEEQGMRAANQKPRAGESADNGIEIRGPLPPDRNTFMPNDIAGARSVTDRQQDI